MTTPEWIAAYGEDLQLVLFFGFYGLMALAELAFPRRTQDPARRKRWPANFLLTVLAIVILMALPLSFFTAAAYASGRGVGLMNMVSLPLAVAVPVALLLRGFISWVTHLLMHKVPLFWRVHRVHHMDTELDVTTTVRFHPLEFLIGLAVGLPLVLAFGLPVWLLMLYELLDAVVVVFSHANVRLPQALERVVRYLVVTPDLHRVHHSTWQPETDSNFSAVFPIWDLLFGTFRAQPHAGHDGMTIGLSYVRDERANGLGWLLMSPFKSTLPGEGRDAVPLPELSTT